MKIQNLLMAVSLIVSASARAESTDWPDSEKLCKDGKCYTVPTQGSAYAAYKRTRARIMTAAGVNASEVAAASAATAVLGGATWGAGKYLTYKASVEAAGKASAIAARAAKGMQLVVPKALGEFFAPRLAQLAAEKGATATAKEVESLLVSELGNAAKAAPLLKSLEEKLGRETAEFIVERLGNSLVLSKALAKRMGSESLEAVMKKIFSASGNKAAQLALEIGTNAVADIAPSAGKVVAGLAFKAAAQGVAGAGAKRVLGWCLSKIGIGLSAVGTVGLSVVADQLLFPSVAGDATMTGFYRRNPDRLVIEGDESKIEKYLEANPLVGTGQLALDLALQEKDRLEAEDDTGPTPKACIQPTVDDPNSDLVCHG